MSGRLQLTIRSPLTPVWLCGWVLFGCMFLPFARGCNNEDIAPYQLYRMAERQIANEGLDAETVAMLAQMQWINSPYVFGLVVAVATLLLAVTCAAASSFRTLWWCYAIPTNLQVLALWISIGYEARTAEDFRLLQFVMSNPWVSWPALFLPMLFVLTRYNCRTWTAAALCVQSVLAFLSACWFTYFIVFGSTSSDLPMPIGVKVALLASIGLFIASIGEWQLASRFVQSPPSTAAAKGSFVRPRPSPAHFSHLL